MLSHYFMVLAPFGPTYQRFRSCWHELGHSTPVYPGTFLRRQQAVQRIGEQLRKVKTVSLDMQSGL
jgi:hypothetical protein